MDIVNHSRSAQGWHLLVTASATLHYYVLANSPWPLRSLQYANVRLVLPALMNHAMDVVTCASQGNEFETYRLFCDMGVDLYQETLPDKN